MSGPTAGWLAGGRLHLQHGPIDLVIEALGTEPERTAAYRQARAAFHPVLDELVAVLPLLRKPVAQLVGAPPTLRSPAHGEQRAIPTAIDSARSEPGAPPPRGPLPPCGGGMGRGVRCPPDDAELAPPLFPPGSVAARMFAATAPHVPVFVTPMAAVAGAVADHVLAAMVMGRRLDRAYVNNGGDAALWLSSGMEIVAAGGPDLSARIRVFADSIVRGIATSGWRGRSHSLGIADAVTVLARTSADADAAATLIANAVDLPGHPAVRRRPASQLAPESDLGERPVTIDVGPLSGAEIAGALAAGRAAADGMLRRGLIEGAALWLGGVVETVGTACPRPALVRG